MEKINSIFILCCLVSINSLAQSSILKLKEESSTGKFHKEISDSGPVMIDINSVLHIGLDIAEIEDQMLKFQGISSSSSRLTKLKKLNTMLRHQNRILNIISENIVGAQKVDNAAFLQLNILKDSLDQEIEDDPDLGEIVNSDEFSEGQESSGKDFVIYTLDFLQNEAQKLRDSLLSVLQVDGKVDSSLIVYFRLGAFMPDQTGGREIHVENFDRIAPDAFTEVSTFSQPLSQDEKNELVKTKDIGDSLLKNYDKASLNLKSVLKGKEKKLFKEESSRSELESIYVNALNALNLNAQTRPAREILLEHNLNLDRVENVYILAKESFSNLAINFPGSLLSEHSLLSTLDSLEKIIDVSFNSFHEDVKEYSDTVTIVAGNTIGPGVIELSKVDTAYANYKKRAEKEISQVKSSVDGVFNLIGSFKKAYLKTEEFSESVNRFTVGSLPPDGMIVLPDIARRKSGDKIILKATFERGKDVSSNRNFEKRTIYRREINISRIALHFKMSGALILADPTTSDPNKIDLDNRFQFVPSYAFFAKWGSRKSKFLNDFLTPGIGLSFSSPDFDTNGIPEFGVAVVTTAFLDILSVGYGFNFGKDTPYWFVGFNLPFNISSLPSANVSSGFSNNSTF